MESSNKVMSVDRRVLDVGVVGAYFSMKNLNNKQNDQDFETMVEEVCKFEYANIALDTIKCDEKLIGFRKLHEMVKVSNRDNVSSPENLLLNLIRNRNIPRVNLLVDIYNLISVQSRFAIGAHDLKKIYGNINLRLTSGDENYWPLGAREPKPVRQNCYAYIDDANDVLCWLEVRQVEKTKVTIDTTECFYIVQGNSATTTQELKDATYKLIELTKRFCGGLENFMHAPWL